MNQAMRQCTWHVKAKVHAGTLFSHRTALMLMTCWMFSEVECLRIEVSESNSVDPIEP